MVDRPLPPTPIWATFTLSFAPFQLEQEVSIVGATAKPADAISDFFRNDRREEGERVIAYLFCKVLNGKPQNKKSI